MRRTREQVQAQYTWMSPADFGESTGTSEEHVRRLIADRWFRPGEVINVARNPAKHREYRIRPEAVERFLAERAVA